MQYPYIVVPTQGDLPKAPSVGETLAARIGWQGSLGDVSGLIAEQGGPARMASFLAVQLPGAFATFRCARENLSVQQVNTLAGLFHMAAMLYGTKEQRLPGRETVLALLREIAGNVESLRAQSTKLLTDPQMVDPVHAALYAWLSIDDVSPTSWWWHFMSLRLATVPIDVKTEGLMLLLAGGARQMAKAREHVALSWTQKLAQGFARWTEERVSSLETATLFRLGLHNLRLAAGDAAWPRLLDQVVEELSFALSHQELPPEMEALLAAQGSRIS